MPNLYAHLRFGHAVKNQVSEDAKRIIEDNIELFDIGVQGPDIFSFYNPIIQINKVKKLGRKEHRSPAIELMTACSEKLRLVESKDAYLAYMYGVICHFALDSMCHGYINDRQNTTGIKHATTEVQFDRLLFKLDDRSFFRYKPAGSIKPTEENAKIIAEVMPEINAKKVLRCLKHMRFCRNVARVPRPKKKCMQSNVQLMKLYNRAIPMAVTLVNQYYANVFNDRPFSKVYDHAFTSQTPDADEIEKMI